MCISLHSCSCPFRVKHSHIEVIKTNQDLSVLLGLCTLPQDVINLGKMFKHQLQLTWFVFITVELLQLIACMMANTWPYEPGWVVYVILYMTYCTQDIRWRARKTGGHRGMIYFAVRASPLSLRQQSVRSTIIIFSYFKEMAFAASQYSVFIAVGRKREREQLVHCQSLKLVIHPIWLVDAASLLPCHSLVIIITGAQTEQEQMEKETELALPLLVCQHTWLMQGLLRCSAGHKTVCSNVPNS